MPLSLLLRLVAQLNPITYILEAMRAILIGGWGGPADIAIGVAVAGGMSLLMFLFALLGLRARRF